jgi:hypothetical protein
MYPFFGKALDHIARYAGDAVGGEVLEPFPKIVENGLARSIFTCIFAKHFAHKITCFTETV